MKMKDRDETQASWRLVESLISTISQLESCVDFAPKAFMENINFKTYFCYSVTSQSRLFLNLRMTILIIK